MHETIFDGEAHLLSDQYGYIAIKVDESVQLDSFIDIAAPQVRKYCEYLYENDREKVIEYLMKIFTQQIHCGNCNEDFQIIFRPACVVGDLNKYGTLAIKFKRSENDNLERK